MLRPNGAKVGRDLRLLKSGYDLTQLVRHFKDSPLPRRWGQTFRDRFAARLDSHPPEAPSVLELDARDFSGPSSELLRQPRPVVFRGAAKAWPCCERWSVDWLCKTHGQDVVLDSDRGSLRYLRHVLSGSLAGTSDYVRFYALVQRHPELLADLNLPGLLRFAGPRSIDQGFQCFVGNRQARTTHLHNANDSNLFIQVTGQKRWCFIGSEFTPLLDPPPVLAEYRSVDVSRAHFDPFDPDFAAFPEFRAVPGYEVTLSAGDILYNPPYVWHAVRNLSDDSLALAYRWLSPEVCARSEPLYFLMDLTARHPPIWKSIQFARNDFSLVFIEQSPRIKESRLYAEYMEQVAKGYSEFERTMAEANRLAR